MRKIDFPTGEPGQKENEIGLNNQWNSYKQNDKGII